MKQCKRKPPVKFTKEYTYWRKWWMCYVGKPSVSTYRCIKHGASTCSSCSKDAPRHWIPIECVRCDDNGYMIKVKLLRCSKCWQYLDSGNGIKEWECVCKDVQTKA